jgi:signal transduction histidine kinase
MDLWHWFISGVVFPEFWAWVTVTLSVLIAVGYGIIAFNWYFQLKLAKLAEARAALSCLRNIWFLTGVCGYAFWAMDMPWLIWRFYDAALFVILIYTWTFVVRMRGLSLVSERLKQIEDLERNAKKYHEIAELLPHMVWTASADGGVDFSNQRWREYVGDDRAWLDALHPDHREQAIDEWNHSLQTRQPFMFEARLAGARAGAGEPDANGYGGGYRWFVIRATPIAQGDAIKWLGACADVEDQKLLAVQKELQAKQKSFFLNALSHDLRAPLHNVLLNAHLLKMSAQTREQDQHDLESVQMIVENAVAAGDLVTRLLDFAKVGALEHNVIQHVGLVATLGQIIRRFQPIADKKQLSLRLIADSDPNEKIKILTDRQKLDRIVSNLLDNAIKYTRSGVVSLELGEAEEPRQGAICIRISDTGMGVPPANVPYLFDEFYQVNNYERDRSKGFGMGLAICRQLARQIGGDVRLASTGPKGSCFELTLDANPPAGEVDESGAAVGADRGGRQSGANGDQPDPEDARIYRV